MTETAGWRVRLRFRVQKRIRIDETERLLQIAGREVVLRPPTKDLKISDSEWLIMNAHGFANEEEARQFGYRLKTALEVSAVAARVGVDTGRNLATSSLGKIVKDALAQQGAHVRDNIHGLDVLADWPHGVVFHAATKAVPGGVVTDGGRVLGVTALGDSIRGAIDEAYAAVGKISWDGMQCRRDIGRRALPRG